MRLVLSRPDGRPLRRDAFNTGVWWPAQQAAGITPEPGEDGKRGMRRGVTATPCAAAHGGVGVAAGGD